MKAIIHIGMMKTGSTSIQTWLHSNRAALEDKGMQSNEGAGRFEKFHQGALKYAVYQTAMHELGADEKTAWVDSWGELKWEGKMYEFCKLLTNQLEKFSGESGTFIYSDETLYKCNETQMIALDKYLSRFFDDRTYVAYIRNTVDFFVSLYSQKLHSSLFFEWRTQEYLEFLKKCANDLVPYGLESSFGNLFDWNKALGDRLNVRLLESDWLVNGDLIEDFASLVGVAAFGKPGRINESFAAEYVEYVRFLNLEYQNGLPRKIREKALEILKDASSGKSKLAASDAQAKSIRDAHREQEEKIRKRFFPDRPFLFSPKFRGCGVAPVPLTKRRKAKIESEIREKMSPEVWVPHEFARSGRRKRARHLREPPGIKAVPVGELEPFDFLLLRHEIALTGG